MVPTRTILHEKTLSVAVLRHRILAYNSLGSRFLPYYRVTLLYCPNLNFIFKERFGNMTRVYYKEAVGAFVVFDITRSDTLRLAEKWKNDLDTKVLLPDGRPIPCVLLGKIKLQRNRKLQLITELFLSNHQKWPNTYKKSILGNKCDQEASEGMFLDPAKMEEFCQDVGFAGYFATSAKDNVNVDEAASFLLGKIVDNDKWSSARLNQEDTVDSIDLMAYRNNMSLSNDKKCNC